jgi:membrane-associated phospholipid phosphatase
VSARANLRPAPPPQRGASLPGARAPLVFAAACALALGVTWALAELFAPAHARDAVALYHFTLLGRPRLDAVAGDLLFLLEPVLFTIWSAAIVAIALARGVPRRALAVAAVLGLAPLTAETLKPLLAHAHAHFANVHVGPASWPSGHATAAMALAWAALLVSPRRLQPLVAVIGGAFAFAVGAALLLLAWHMPSDVLGGYLVATLWAALAIAALRAAGRRWPAGADVQSAPPPAARWEPGSHRGSRPSSAAAGRFAARLRMNNRSESRFR